MTISSPTYDPTSTATAMAQKFTQPTQDILTSQTKDAQAVGTGLTSLGTAISTFQTSLGGMTGLNMAMFAQSAALSDPSIGSASATSAAAPGSYSFFVQQVATASQVAYTNLQDNGVDGGSVGINFNGAFGFTVGLTGADTSGDGVLSVRELAAAINKSSANTGLVSAAVVTVGGTQQLMLTSTATGAANAVTLDASKMNASGLKTALATAANFNTVVTAKDAIAWLGDYGTGTQIQQASNTFSNIGGVKVTFNRAQPAGATPVTVTVGPDSAATQKNVQGFIDAYNTLKSAIDKMVDAGDPTNNLASGVFAHDAGVRALRDQLITLLRPAGSESLAAYGITATRDGSLTLDGTRLAKQLAKDPTGLDTLMGSTATPAGTGIAGQLDTLLKRWSDSTSGQIKQRSDANAKQQKDLANRQTDLDDQYNAAYQRYLLQFTQLQTLQGQMNSNSSMFDALFGTSDKSSN
jgi:flagellar hook-associated protein 2